MLKHTDNRYQNIGGRLMDTEMEPKVAAAQAAYAKTKEGKRDEKRAVQIEEQKKIHEYLEKDEEEAS